MDKQKKKELAEKDERWNFEKTVEVPLHPHDSSEFNWDKIRKVFNDLQDDHGDLYMKVSKMPSPNTRQKLKLKYRQWQTEGEQVTFHHRQVYEWFEALANHLDISVGDAIHTVLYKKDSLRETLDLGETMNVDINNMGEMTEPSESKVSKEELQEMVDND